MKLLNEEEEGEVEVEVQQVLGEKDAEGRPHGEVRCRGLVHRC